MYRIALEALAVTLGREARARAIQLPAWNEALGLPRPWDQQWSLRLQQILAYETDVLDYPDIFEGSKVMEGLVEELVTGAREEMARVAELGGAVQAVDYMKSALVESHRQRWRRSSPGSRPSSGMNRFESTEPSPLTADAGRRHPRRRPRGRGPAEGRPGALAGRARPGGGRRGARRAGARRPRRQLRTSCRPPSPPPGPGVTTGEWSQTLREAFGEYRAPTGVGEAAGVPAQDLTRAARRGRAR